LTVQFIAIGASLGGVKALKSLFALIPKDFAIPMAIVLHRAKDHDNLLVELLQKATHLHVREAVDKCAVEAHTITVAPADYHMLVNDNYYSLSLEGPAKNARPSIDVFFGSVADTYADQAVGIILSGGGNDGIAGLNRIMFNGGRVMVQSPEEALDPTLPAAIIAANIVPQGLTIANIGLELSRICQTS
jgi:two-component system chemotaxis response regulator CheB